MRSSQLVTDPQQTEAHHRRPIPTLVGYALMVVLTILVFLWIRAQGESLTAPPPASAEPVATSVQGSDSFLRVLVALTAIIVLGQVLAKLFAYVSQPPVIGE